MSVVGHGLDLVELRRVQRLWDRHEARFLSRVFTPTERDYCLSRKRPIEHLAGRFAAKEAVMKVLGLGWSGGVAWTDIEVRNTPSGRPEVNLSGRCAERAGEMNVTKVFISISHIATHAIASAIGVSDDSRRAR